MLKKLVERVKRYFAWRKYTNLKWWERLLVFFGIKYNLHFEYFKY